MHICIHGCQVCLIQLSPRRHGGNMDSVPAYRRQMSVGVMILVQICRNRQQPRARYAIAVCIQTMASGAIMLKDSPPTLLVRCLEISCRREDRRIWSDASKVD